MQVAKALKVVLDLLQVADMGTGWVIAGVVLAVMGVVFGGEDADND